MAAQTIGSAYVQILPSAQGIQGNLEKVLSGPADVAGAKAGKGFSGKFIGALGTLGKGMLTATAALGAGATAAGGAFAAAAGNVAQYGDNIDKMSQKMGLSAEKYQEWDAIMQHSGTSMEAMKAGMKTLANAAETNNKAFAELGPTQEQVAGMSQEELFEATIAGLQNVEDTTKRTYLAGKLLGRGATELGPLLNTSAEETEKMRQRVHELGGVMSNDAVKAAAKFQDSLQDMKTAIGGAGRSLISEFLPGMSEVMDGIGDIFSGREGTEKIEQGVDKLIGAAETAIPKAMEVGGKIVDKLGTAILDNGPRLMEMGGGMLLNVAQGIFDKLPELPGAAFAMIVSLANTLAEQAPTLIPSGVEATLNFVDGVLANSDQLVDAGGNLLVCLVTGLIDSVPLLVERGPELVLHLVEAIIRAAPKLFESAMTLDAKLSEGIHKYRDALIEAGMGMLRSVGEGFFKLLPEPIQWGADMIDNFVSGINKRMPNLQSALSFVAKLIRNYIGFSEPKEGPLSNFHTYGPDMMEGYANDITSNAWRVRSALEQSMALGDAFRAAPAARGWTAQGVDDTPAPRFVDGARGAGTAGRLLQVTLVLERRKLAQTIVELGDEERQRIGVRLTT